jgi:hypothetical protein
MGCLVVELMTVNLAVDYFLKWWTVVDLLNTLSVSVM